MASNQDLKHFGYELRLLLGADEIIKSIEADGRCGNIINYFKDSVYLHARNLLNALTDNVKQYDTELGPIPSGITSSLYAKLKQPIEVYVLHIYRPRNLKGVTNVIDGREVNDYCHDLTKEVKRCWNQWIMSTHNSTDKRRLQDLLRDAETSARDDSSRFEQLVKGSV